MQHTQLSADFQSLPPLLTSKLGPSGADSQVGGFVYVLGLCGSLHELFCEAGSFSCLLNLHRFFQSEVLRLYFHMLESWVAWSVSLLSSSSWFIHTQMWVYLLHQPLPCHESSPPCLPSLPLLQVWMKFSSLTPWLSDLHTVQFSVSSDCFFVFKFVVILLLDVQGS